MYWIVSHNASVSSFADGCISLSSCATFFSSAETLAFSFRRFVLFGILITSFLLSMVVLYLSLVSFVKSFLLFFLTMVSFCDILILQGGEVAL